jgi:hypothetical protein
VLSQSERKWEDGIWRPWQLDRRHTLRLQFDATAGRHWSLFAAADLQSGQPLTPVAEVVWRDLPGVPGQTDTLRDIVPRYRYAPEGSGRSAATFHCDLGARAQFPGPWGSRLQLGLSLTNVTFGPVAPEEPVAPAAILQQPGRGVWYQRRFDLPAVPSMSVRIVF